MLAEALTALADLPHLEVLLLTDCPLDDACMRALGMLTRLKHLDITRTGASVLIEMLY